MARRKARDARAVALRCLSYRDMSTAELRNKLKGKDFEAHEVDSTIDDLVRAGYLNDDRFADSLVNSRIRNKSWGPARISADLFSKGISGETISKVLPKGETVEKTAAEAFRKWVRKKGLPPPLEAKDYARAYRFLKGLGYPSYVIILTLGGRNGHSSED